MNIQKILISLLIALSVTLWVNATSTSATQINFIEKEMLQKVDSIMLRYNKKIQKFSQTKQNRISKALVWKISNHINKLAVKYSNTDTTPEKVKKTKKLLELLKNRISNLYKQKAPVIDGITDFTTCQKAGWDILEKYPRVCVKNKQYFDEVIQESKSFEVTGVMSWVNYGKDGYTAKIVTQDKEVYYATISFANLWKNHEKYVEYKKWKKVTFIGDLWTMWDKKQITVRDVK